MRHPLRPVAIVAGDSSEPAKPCGKPATRQQQRAYAAAAANRGRSLGKYGEGDPATADRHYSDEELDFLKAVDRFVGRTGNQFPDACDYLNILKSLGYEKANA